MTNIKNASTLVQYLQSFTFSQSLNRTMSSTSPHPAPKISSICHLAHIQHRPYELATHAQVYISYHASSPSAWAYLALALHALRRHTKAAYNFRVALALSRNQTPKNVPTLRLLLRISYMLAGLRDNGAGPSPTARLRVGWYRAKLEARLADGEVVFLRRCAGFSPPDTLPLVSLDTCAIVQDADPGCFEWPTFTRHSCERCIDASVIPSFPLAQTAGGYLFLKDRVVSLGCDCYDEANAPCRHCREFLPLPVALFPKLPLALPSSTRVLGGPLFGVHVATGLVASDMHALLVEKLGRLAARRQDAPVKNYHNIIDPNIAAVNGRWVPTEFSVVPLSTSEALDPLYAAFKHYTGVQPPNDVLRHIDTLSGSPRFYATARLRSAIPDLDAHKHAALHVGVQHVLSVALPFLANLQLPALLLPGPLQVVVKAQRIVLAEDEQYAGVWHEDGLREHVIAIVIYYYGISATLTGGDMEFASKTRIPMWVGDGVGPYEYNKTGALQALRDHTVKAPVQEGSMLVFSNYALVHRVLRMVAEGGGGSRDFLALFIIDQQHPLPVPDRLGPRKERIRRRADMLCEQLQVRGRFGLDSSEVTTTGNGQYTDIAWIRSGKCEAIQASRLLPEEDEVAPIVSRLNMFPPVIGRGSSFLNELELPMVEFNAASKYVLHVLEGRERRQIFVDTRTYEYSSEREVPDDGIHEVRVFDSMEEWLDHGRRPYWTKDDTLARSMASTSKSSRRKLA